MINITVKLSSGKEIILTEEEYKEFISLFSSQPIQPIIPISIPYPQYPIIPCSPSSPSWYPPVITWTAGATNTEGKRNS